MFGFKESLNRVHICIVYGCDCNLSTSITTPHTWSAPPPLRALWIVAGLLEGARQIMMEFYKLV